MARRRRRKTDEAQETVEQVVTTPEDEEEQIVESVPVSELEPFDEYTSDYDAEPTEVIEDIPLEEVFDDEDIVVEEEPEVEDVIEEVVKQPEPKKKGKKKDLNKFFEQDQKKVEKFKKKKEKPPKVKKKSKRQLQKEKDYEAIKDKRIFKYKGKKYTKVEDFIKYLNDHYLDIEQIASDVLEDENFLGWISKKSGTFSESIKKFKEIKQEIENN